MAVDHRARQAEFDAQAPHLVLEQLAQRLDQAQLHVLGQAADIVVALDDVGLAGLAAGRFDHVRVDRALGQPPGVLQLARLFLEDLDEQVADDLALGLRVGHAFERLEVAVCGVDADHLHAHVLGEHRHHLVAFLPAQQAGVDEHAGQLLADGLVQQGRDHRGIDATGQAQDHLVRSDLLAHARDLVVDDVGRGPQRLAAADIDHEAAQQGLALQGVGDLGVELHAVPALVLVGHRRDRDAVGGGGDREARRHLGHVVAMAHPHVEAAGAGVVGQPGEQCVRRDDVHLRMAELALVGGFGGTAELRGEGLHAIADAEDRQAAVEHLLRRGGRTGQRGRLGAARQDDALGAERGDLGRVVVPGPDLAVHADLADAARDQLRVLRAEVEDQDLVGMDVGHAAQVYR